jgi:hypothetical protein
MWLYIRTGSLIFLNNGMRSNIGIPFQVRHLTAKKLFYFEKFTSTPEKNYFEFLEKLHLN